MSSQKQRERLDNMEIEPGIRFNDLVGAAARVLRDPDSDVDLSTNRSGTTNPPPASRHQPQQQPPYPHVVPETPPRRPPSAPREDDYYDDERESSPPYQRGSSQQQQQQHAHHQQISQALAAAEQRKEQDLVTSILDSSDVDAVLEAAEERHRLEMLQLFDQMKSTREETSKSMERSPPYPRFPRKQSPQRGNDNNQQQQQQHHQRSSSSQPQQYQDPNEAIDQDRLVVPHEYAAANQHQSRSGSQMDRASIARSRSLPPPTPDDVRSVASDQHHHQQQQQYPHVHNKRFAPPMPVSPTGLNKNNNINSTGDFSQAAWNKAHQQQQQQQRDGIPPLDLSRLERQEQRRQQQQHGTESSLSDTDSDDDRNMAIAHAVNRAPDSNIAAARNRPPLAPTQSGSRYGRPPIMAPAPEQLNYDSTTGDTITAQNNSNINNNNAPFGTGRHHQHHPQLVDTGVPRRQQSMSQQRQPSPMRNELLSTPLYNATDPNSGGYGQNGDILAPLPPVSKALENRGRSASAAGGGPVQVMPSPRRVMNDERGESQQQHNEPANATYFLPQPYYPPTLAHLREQSMQNSVSRHPPTLGRAPSIGAGCQDKPPSSVIAVIVPASAKQQQQQRDDDLNRGPSNSPVAVAPPYGRRNVPAPPPQANPHVTPDDGLDDETSFGPISSSQVSARPRPPPPPPGQYDGDDDDSENRAKSPDAALLPDDNMKIRPPGARRNSDAPPVVVRVDPKGANDDTKGKEEGDDSGEAEGDALPAPKEKEKSCC